MLDIVAAFFAAVGFTGNWVLLWLFHRQVHGFPILYRYVRLQLLAWTLLILYQSTSFTALDLRLVPSWFPEANLPSLRILSFCSLMAVATWQLIRELLLPRLVPAVAKPDAHVQMDPYGCVVGWNAEAAALFGWTADEIVGQDLADVLIPEKMRAMHRAGLEQYRLTGEAPLVDSRYTQLALRKDGSSLLVDISLTAHVTSRGTIFLGTCAPARIL